EIGEHLKECQPEEPIYNEWISAYGSDWFRTLVEEQITRLDTIAENVTEADRKRMKQHFIISSQYEYSFWEMAYTLEKWPVDKDVKDVIG
ncbi:thiaminase II, partial [Bacillus sp. ZZQ-131]